MAPRKERRGDHRGAGAGDEQVRSEARPTAPTGQPLHIIPPPTWTIPNEFLTVTHHTTDGSGTGLGATYNNTREVIQAQGVGEWTPDEIRQRPTDCFEIFDKNGNGRVSVNDLCFIARSTLTQVG